MLGWELPYPAAVQLAQHTFAVAQVHEAPAACSTHGRSHKLGGETLSCTRICEEENPDRIGRDACQAALMEEAPTLLPTLK